MIELPRNGDTYGDRSSLLLRSTREEVLASRFYYGWLIVTVSFITLVVSFGIWYSFSVFFVAILDSFGWTRATAASIFSIFMIVHSAATLMVGPLLDRFGPRWVIPSGAALAALGLFATSQIDSLGEFYFFYGIVTAMGLCATGSLSHSIFLPRWFVRKRGLAMGIAMAGVGVGMVLMVPLSQSIIARSGWRAAYCVLGGLLLAVVIPLNAVLQRQNPAEIGLIPDGEECRPLESENRNAAGRLTHALWETLPERRFWFLLLTYFATPFATQGPLIHQVAYMVDKGFTASEGALVLGLTGIMGSQGKIFFGYLSDRIGRERAFLLGMSCAFLGILSLMAISKNREAILYGYAVLFGLGYGSIAPIYPARAADLFEGAHFGRVFAVLALVRGLGGGLGTWLYGKLYDMTQSYGSSFMVVLMTIILISILFWFSSPSPIHQNEG